MTETDQFYVFDSRSTPLGSVADAIDPLSRAFAAKASVIVVPKQRLPRDFFLLKTRLAVSDLFADLPL